MQPSSISLVSAHHGNSKICRWLQQEMVATSPGLDKLVEILLVCLCCSDLVLILLLTLNQRHQVLMNNSSYHCRLRFKICLTHFNLCIPYSWLPIMMLSCLLVIILLTP